MGLFSKKKKKVALVSGMSFSFIVKPQLPENVKGDLFERLIEQSKMSDYFSEPRLLYGHEDRQPILIIRFWESNFSKPIDDPIYKEFHQTYSSFVIKQFEDTDYSCGLLEAGMMVKVESGLTEVIYLDKDGNHILHTGKELNTFKELVADSQEKGETTNRELTRGNELSNQGNYEGAIKCFEKVLELEPDNPTALTCKGIALADLGRESESMQCFDSLLESEPNVHATINNKAQALSRLGKLDEAIELYDKIIEINPNYEKAYYNKGLIFQEREKLDEAIELYDKAIEINPNYEKALISKNLAQIKKNISSESIPLSSKWDLEIICPFCEQKTRLIQLSDYEVDRKNPADTENLSYNEEWGSPEMSKETYDSFKTIMKGESKKFMPIIAKFKSHNNEKNKNCSESNKVLKVFFYFFIDHENQTAGFTFRVIQKIP